MKLNDRIYGTMEITEPVLIELINSRPVQRLKDVEQHGIPRKFNSFPSFWRYEHTVGVMLLLRKLGSNLEEQIAGLLHDVSHTAFSHIFDWVMGSNLTEDYQDKTHSKIIFNSEVPQILSKYGFNVNKIVEIKQFPLLEKDAPSLCADRLDYTLREFQDWANPSIVDACINNLTTFQNQIVFKSRDVAEEFARCYMKCQAEHWGGAQGIIKFHLLSQTFRIAMEKGILAIDDFYQDDSSVMQKLTQNDDEEIKKMLKQLSNLKFEFSDNPQLSLRKKFRYVDPEILENGKVFRLSELKPEFGIFLEEQRKINEKGINVNIL